MLKQRAVRVCDLPKEPGREFLFCPSCGGEYSATRGDYFLLEPDAIMRCCRRMLKLVTRHCTLRAAIMERMTEAQL